MSEQQSGPISSSLSEAVSGCIRALGLIWVAAPRWTSGWVVLLVFQGLLPAASIYLIKLVVDRLLLAIESHGAWARLQPALVVIGITAAVMLLSEVLQSISEWVRTAQSELVQDHIKGLIHEQSVNVDMAVFETPEFHDRLERACSEAASPIRLLESCGNLLQSAVTLMAMAAVLVRYSVFLPFILAAGGLPVLFVSLKFDRRYHRWWEQRASDRRWTQYFDLMLTHPQAAAEIRLFSLGAHFRSAYSEMRSRLRAERIRQLRDQSLARLAAGILGLLVFGATMIWMVWHALRGSATLGDVALFYTALNKGQTVMRSFLGNVGQVYSSSEFLGELFTFLKTHPELTSPACPESAPQALARGIELRGVSFCYPGCERPVLRDFNLSIPSGKVVALVGPNGAGKSTILKLLCRFYDPQAGDLKIDDVDIRQFRIDDIRRMITVLFQFPLNLYGPVKSSISLGDVDAAHSDDEIEQAARSAGAHDIIARMPQGYDTVLGKWFSGGIELSGGEWQRLATARAYLRRSPIIILDEPTSFMDPWAEAEWFKRFTELAKERTAIIITHRFTMAMRADQIHVIQDGEVVESGSHCELLSRGGLYANSWTSQMNAGFFEAGAADSESESIQPVVASDPSPPEVWRGV